MNGGGEKKVGWKQRATREFIEYCINVAYLTVFFGAFTWYRRLILAHYGIAYLHYWISLIKALILAKVIMIADLLGLGRRFENKPLIVPTMYRTVVFTVFVAAFAILEHTIGGLLKGKGLAGGFYEFKSEGWYELLARCLVIFFAFIPFFAFKELGRVLGKGRIVDMFFRKKGTANHR
jgi:hypothetical protein